MTNTVSRTVSDETLDAIIQIESGGNPRAQAKTSSALGLGQFLNKTWLGVVKKYRPDLMARGEGYVLSMRTNPTLCIEMLARFTEENQHAIGMNCTGGDLYLAHFLGVADAKDLFRAAPETPVSTLVSPQVISANLSIMRGKSAGQVRAWAAKRMHESGGHGWISKLYRPMQPVRLVDDVAPDPEPETAEDIPDTQDAPAAPVERPDPVPAVTPATPIAPIGEGATTITPVAREGFFDWIKRRAKTVASVITGGSFGVGGLSYFSDWKIAAVIVGGIIIAGTIVGIFYLLTRPKP